MKESYFSTDTKIFIQLLHKYSVRYMIVGGEAVIYYGYPRLTGDVDFFYENNEQNIHVLYDALLDFWDGDIPGIDNYDELGTPGYVIQFGVPPNRIDLINKIEGVTFEEAWPQKNTEEITIQKESVPLYIIGLSHLIQNKRATGRNKDLEDLNYLESI